MLGSCNTCKKLLQMFYQSLVASVLIYAAVCRGGNIKKRDTARLDRMVRRAQSWTQWWQWQRGRPRTNRSPCRGACSAEDCSPSPAPLTDSETLSSPWPLDKTTLRCYGRGIQTKQTDWGLLILQPNISFHRASFFALEHSNANLHE